MRKTLLLTPLTLLVVVTVLSQTSFSPSSTLRENQAAESTQFVTLNVIVTDGNGHYVEGLSAEQFEIYDNNVKQEITHFAIDNSRTSLGIVYEVNENDTEQLSGVLNALKQFVSTLQSAGCSDDYILTDARGFEMNINYDVGAVLNLRIARSKSRKSFGSDFDQIHSGAKISELVSAGLVR